MKERRYSQLCVEAPGGADGPGLAGVLRQVLEVIAADWAALSDMDLVGPTRVSLLAQGHEVRVISVPHLIDLLEQAGQVVWATVFLCGSREQAARITGSEDFVSALAKADGLVRVVDASSYYVYGPTGLFGALRGELSGELKEGSADELDFPE